MSDNLPVIAHNTALWDTPDGIAAIKHTVAKGATDAQLVMFLNVCRATGLNPFMREIWFVAQTGMIMAGRDGYLAAANRDPNFDGMETRVEWDDKHEFPVKAVCTVWRKDRNHPVTMEAYWSDYYKPNSQVWKQYKAAMISKCAEALALKRSFGINGVVTEEEISQNPGNGHQVETQSAEVIPSDSVVSDHDDALSRLRTLFKQLPKAQQNIEFLKTICPVSEFAQLTHCSTEQLEKTIERLSVILSEQEAA